MSTDHRRRLLDALNVSDPSSTDRLSVSTIACIVVWTVIPFARVIPCLARYWGSLSDDDMREFDYQLDRYDRVDKPGVYHALMTALRETPGWGDTQRRIDGVHVDTTQLYQRAEQLFEEKRPPIEVVEDLVKFWTCLTRDDAQRFYQILANVVQKRGREHRAGGAAAAPDYYPRDIEYMKVLTSALQKVPAWREMNERLALQDKNKQKG